MRDRTGLVGVFSAAALMSFTSDTGFEALSDDLRIGDLKKALSVDDDRKDRYLFFDRNATLTMVRAAFERRQERNHRLAAVFITENGDRHSQVLAMLTAWDVLGDA